jgi:PAS domain S-box-containing protein
MMGTIQSNQLRILVADDEKTILKLYQRILSPKKDKPETISELGELAGKLFREDTTSTSTLAFDLVTCRQGDEAIDIVKKSFEEDRPFAVAFLDVQMPPGPDGVWVAEQIRVLDPHIEIVLVTGYSDITLKDIAPRIPPAHKLLYVQKPFHPREISQFASALGAKWLMECELQKIREELEKRVQDRTVELMKTNEQLKAEIENRKQMEKALRKSEASMRAIVDTAADGIITFNKKGLIESFNLAAERIFGYYAEEIIGQNIHLLIPSLSCTEYNRYQPSYRVTDKEQIIGTGHKLTGRRNNGDAFPIDFAVSEVRMGDQQMFTGIVRDITEQERAEQERIQLSAIQHELAIARDIQQSLLPKPKPEWSDIDVICYSIPAHEVGGDFYSYHAFDPLSNLSSGSLNKGKKSERKFALTVGDASGKGISAALLMATTLSQFDAALSLNFTPAERLVHLDKAILPYTKPRRQNCALCYTEFYLPHVDPQSSQHNHSDWILRAANAGCIPPYIKRTDGSVEWLDIGGIPLGMGIGAQIGYQEAHVNLSAGDMVILTSDGVAEATTSTDELFGFARLEAAITNAPITSAQAMLDHLKGEIATFVGDVEPHDDVTIVVLQV